MNKKHSYWLSWKLKIGAVSVIAAFVLATSALTTDQCAGVDYTLATEVGAKQEAVAVDTVVEDEAIALVKEVIEVDESAWEAYVTELPFSDEEIDILSKAVWGHAHSTGSRKQMAAIAWVVMNRVDAEGFPDDIISVVTQKAQFQSFSWSNPVDETVREIVIDVLNRYTAEKNGATEVGRILSKEYLYFRGDGYFNYFYENWQ